MGAGSALWAWGRAVPGPAAAFAHLQLCLGGGRRRGKLPSFAQRPSLSAQGHPLWGSHWWPGEGPLPSGAAHLPGQPPSACLALQQL